MRRLSWLLALVTAAASTVVASVVVPPGALADPVPCLGETGPEAGALAMAQRCDRRVEATSLRSETTQVFALPNGRLQAEVAGGPVRLRKGNGWVPVDLTLERRADGSVASKAHPFDLKLAGKATGGTSDLATLGAAGKGRMGYGWRGALPEPVLDGTKATYRDVKPGVDMVIEATRSGFEQFLVVKDRAALREVRSVSMPLRTGGHKLRKDRGHVKLDDDGGATKADGAAPVMWDAAISPLSGEPKFPSPVGVDLVGGGADPDLVLTPDSGYLADPARTFPVTIDPGVAHTFTGALFDTMTHSGYLNTDLSGYTDLRLGYVNDAGVISKARSYLRWPTSVGGLPLGGAKIYSATLSLFEFWSFSCTSSWWYAELVGAVGTGTRYNNDSGLWSYLDTREGTNATTGYSSSCGDNWVSISVQKAVQRAADLRYGDMTIGLKGWNDAEPGHETDSKTWKKFNSSNAGSNIPKLTIEFNHLPAASQLRLNGDAACGVGEGVRRYLPNTTQAPNFTVRSDDVNTGQNQRAQLELLADGVSVWAQDDDQWIAPGQTATMDLAYPLQNGPVYTYRMRTQDGVDWSPWTAPCEMQVADPPDAAPEITLPDETVWAWGTPVPVTFRPAVGDVTEVAEYRYGFSPDRLDMRAVAKRDGSATVPITLWSADQSTLHVKAYNAAGQSTDAAAAALDIWPPDTPPPAAPFRVTGDGNGDGKADVTIVNDLGGGRTQLLDLTGKTGGGVYEPRVLMDNQAYPAATTRWVRGDFDGDGRTDQASFRDKGTSAVTLQVLRSNGNSLADVQVWDSTGDGQNRQVGRSAFLAANFDGDAGNRDDLAMITDLGGGTWKVEVFVANGSPTTVFSPVQWWYSAPANSSEFNRIKWVAGKFVGNDTAADLGAVYTYDGCTTKMWYQQSQPAMAAGQKFQNGVWKWDSGAGNWCGTAATYVAGDYTGDGLTDVVATYAFGGCQTNVYSFTTNADGTVTGAVERWRSSATGATDYWCGDIFQPQLGDVNGDGKADLVAVYNCCGPNQRRVWTFTSTGTTGFAAPVLRWEGATGRPGTGSVSWTATSRFQLVAWHSNLCLSVPGASTGDSVQLVQETCNANSLNQQFTIDRRGAAYANLRPAHTTGKCVDVRSSSMADAAVVQQYTCNYGAAQAFVVDYYRGFTATVGQPQASDVQVRVLSINSGKCLDVAGVSTAPGAPIQQYTCIGNPNQQFYLRPTTA